VKAETVDVEDTVPDIKRSVSVQLDASPFTLHWMSMLTVTPSSTIAPNMCAVEDPSANVKVGSGPSSASSSLDPRTN